MATDDFINVLSERYGERCKIIKDQGDYSRIIRIRFPNNDDVQVQVAIPIADNSESKVDVFVRGGQPEVRSGLERRVQEFGAIHIGDVDKIAQLFEFCDKLLNEAENNANFASSPKKPAQQQKKKAAKNNNLKEEETSSKKPGMKTAYDVIKRLRWDKSLPVEHFSVGYLDRFLGIIQKPFSAFNWEDDLVDAAITDLAIPQHRIQYFKYRNAKVWDKNERMDYIFNSVTDDRTIYEIIQAENEKCGEPNVVAAVEENDDFEDNGIEADLEEDDVDVAPIEIVQDLPKGVRPDYFLFIPVDDPTIRSRADMVQDSFKTHFPKSIKTLTNLDHLHITVALFCSRDQPLGVDSVVSAINAELATLSSQLSSTSLQFKGLSLLADRVLCSCPGDEMKSEVYDKLKIIFDKYGLKFYASSIPHLTIGKLNLQKDPENVTAIKSSVLVSRFNGVQPIKKLMLRPVGIKSESEWTFNIAQ